MPGAPGVAVGVALGDGKWKSLLPNSSKSDANRCRGRTHHRTRVSHAAVQSRSSRSYSLRTSSTFIPLGRTGRASHCVRGEPLAAASVRAGFTDVCQRSLSLAVPVCDAELGQTRTLARGAASGQSPAYAGARRRADAFHFVQVARNRPADRPIPTATPSPIQVQRCRSNRPRRCQGQPARCARVHSRWVSLLSTFCLPLALTPRRRRSHHPSSPTTAGNTRLA